MLLVDLQGVDISQSVWFWTVIGLSGVGRLGKSK